MKLYKVIIWFLVVITAINYAYSQQLSWRYYYRNNSPLPDNQIIDIKIGKTGEKWIAHSKGLSRLQIGNLWTSYTSQNSGLPNQSLTSLAVDKAGVLWMGSFGGLIRYDGNNWTIYETSNSAFPTNKISSLTIDRDGNKWMILDTFGIGKFDGINLTILNRQNSGLPLVDIRRLHIDSMNHIWLLTANTGVIRFDGSNWIVYNKQNSAIQSNSIRTMCVDRNNHIWTGSLYDGMSRFDGNVWIPYAYQNNSRFLGSTVSNWGDVYFGTENTSTNSKLIRFSGANGFLYDYPNDFQSTTYQTSCMAIEDNGDIWIGTQLDGIIQANVYQTEINSDNLSSDLVHIYPNPGNNRMAISTSDDCQFQELRVKNSIGQEIISVTQVSSPNLSFDTSEWPSGIYFISIATNKGNLNRCWTKIE